MVLADGALSRGQTRRRTPKVKTGCKTCKIRHVKCDETKPNCNRCSSTGRNCDGYAPIKEDFKIQIWSHAHTPGPYNATRAFADFGDNVRYLEFYHRCARRSLSSHFDNDFWSKIVLQMAHSESAVRHALVALGFLCQSEHGSMKHARAKFAVDEDYRFVLSQYNKAVRALVSRMTDTAHSCEVALVTCLLFVCMEYLRGNYHTAFTHMKNGLGIITERQEENATATKKSLPSTTMIDENTQITKSSRFTDPMPLEYLKRDYIAAPHPVAFHKFPRPTPNSTSVVENTLVPIFIRGIASALTYGVTTTDSLDVLSLMPSLLHQKSFADLNEAHQACYELRNSAILHLRTTGQQSLHRKSPTDEDCQRRDCLLDSHLAWFEKAKELERDAVFSEEEKIALSSMKLSHYTTFILTACSLDRCEVKSDIYLEEFQEILHHAKVVMEYRARTTTHGAHFTFEMCIILPLFLVSTRCRCPVTRRTAVAILAQNPPREGLWDAQQHLLVAKRAIDIEERELDPITGWPSERSRLASCVISADMDRAGGFWASFLPARWVGQSDEHGKQRILQEFFHV